jgi:beta-glucanase (GH16 family)
VKHALLLVLFCCMAGMTKGKWVLSWSEEFNTDGVLNTANWHNRVVGPGWVNGEQQRYTDGHDQSASNIYVKGGNLIIVAKRAGANGEITSGRIEGEGHQQFMYGRLEARARLPITQGMWPAFWMEGWDINKGAGWPASGEIDIMEGRGSMPKWTSGSFHCSAGTPVRTGVFTLTASEKNFHDGFHTFAIEWNQDSISWFADTTRFVVLRKSEVPSAPINKNYFFLINLAVGGHFDGNVDNTTVFPESLIVDYVRVYKWDPNGAIERGTAGPNAATVRVAQGATRLSVAMTRPQEFAWEVLSIDGRRMAASAGRSATFSVPTTTFASGLYFLKIVGAIDRYRGAFVVK